MLFARFAFFHPKELTVAAARIIKFVVPSFAKINSVRLRWLGAVELFVIVHLVPPMPCGH